MRRALATVSSLILAGCTAATATTPTPTPITPAQATLAATASFVPFSNSLGDKLEALNVHITSNIPTPVRVQLDLRVPASFVVHDGDKYKACVPDGCLLDGAANADWWCSDRCPAGTYQLTLTVCSYAENKSGLESWAIICNRQETGYLRWVSHFGQALKPNPQATADPDHPAILNLRDVVTFSR